jgi:hypothetical protein
MKKFVALLVMLVTGSSLLAQTPAPAPSPTPAPATPAKPGAKPEAKKPEPEPVIDGFVIQRKNGTYLSLTIVDGKFNLRFYDKKKKPAAPDVDRAMVRWNNPHGPGDNRTILNPGRPGYAGRALRG